MKFGEKLRQLMAERQMSQRRMAELVPCNDGYVSRVARGLTVPSAEMAARFDEVLGAGGELAALRPSAPVAAPALDDELEALDLVRRVSASDVGEETLVALEMIVDEPAAELAWIGDPAAEPYARGVLARLERPSPGPARPRRAASARLDLALALLAAGQPDEAAHTALEAVTSGCLVPSNYWRAAEVITAVDARGVPVAAELGEAYRELCAAIA